VLSQGGNLQFELPYRASRNGQFPDRTPPSDDNEAEGLSLDELVSRERAIVSKVLERSWSSEWEPATSLTVK